VLGAVVLLCIDWIKSKGGDILMNKPDEKGRKTENFYGTA